MLVYRLRPAKRFVATPATDPAHVKQLLSVADRESPGLADSLYRAMTGFQYRLPANIAVETDIDWSSFEVELTAALTASFERLVGRADVVARAYPPLRSDGG